MHRWRRDLEKLCHFGFRRRATVQRGVLVNIAEKLALPGGIGRFHFAKSSNFSTVRKNQTISNIFFRL
jgi:hypothetical protein